MLEMEFQKGIRQTGIDLKNELITDIKRGIRAEMSQSQFLSRP